MTSFSAGGAGILSLTIKDKAVLYAAYMPYVNNGGLFIPTNKSYSIGDEVFVLLNLMDEPEKIPVAGKVIWITPKGAQGNRSAGIGIQFADEASIALHKIETHLAGMVESERPTHTM
jgi:type IV pilus assembly protein PilZ